MALGLTFGQLGIGTNIYTLYIEGGFDEPQPQRREVCHDVSNSTYFPTKTVGYERVPVSGVILVLGSALAACESDILGADTERKISWVRSGAEVYLYAKGGRVSTQRLANNKGGSTDYYLVNFSFLSTRTTLFLASDDSPLWGN